MKKVIVLIVCALFTGLFVGSVYAGVEPSPMLEKSFDPQPEPPGISSISAGNPVTLPDGTKLELVKNDRGSRVYLIQKNGTRKLADGIFTLPDGKRLTIHNGVIAQGR